MLLAIDHHFKLSEGSHHLDLQMVHYATIDEVLHKKSHTKPPMALLIPLNDSMYRYGLLTGIDLWLRDKLIYCSTEVVDS